MTLFYRHNGHRVRFRENWTIVSFLDRFLPVELFIAMKPTRGHQMMAGHTFNTQLKSRSLWIHLSLVIHLVIGLMGQHHPHPHHHYQHQHHHHQLHQHHHHHHVRKVPTQPAAIRVTNRNGTGSRDSTVQCIVRVIDSPVVIDVIIIITINIAIVIIIVISIYRQGH